MINSDKELIRHFKKIRKEHWLDFDVYIKKKTVPYIKETSPHLFKTKGLNIFDVGPGPGHYTKCLKSIGHNVYGIDRRIDSDTMEAYKYLSKKHLLNHVYGGVEAFVELENFGYEEKFDIINCRGSIWHVLRSFEKAGLEPTLFFKRAANSMKDNGVLILSIDLPSVPKSMRYMNKQTSFRITKVRDGLYFGKPNK